MIPQAEYERQVHDLSLSAREHLTSLTLEVGSILYLSQVQQGTAIPTRQAVERGWLRVVGLLVVCLAISASPYREKPMASEIDLSMQCEMQSRMGNWSSILETAGEMNRAGQPASAAYWEGIAWLNLGQTEKSAQAFVLAGKYRHPLAEMALKKVRQ